MNNSFKPKVNGLSELINYDESRAYNVRVYVRDFVRTCPVRVVLLSVGVCACVCLSCCPSVCLSECLSVLVIRVRLCVCL